MLFLDFCYLTLPNSDLLCRSSSSNCCKVEVFASVSSTELLWCMREFLPVGRKFP